MLTSEIGYGTSDGVFVNAVKFAQDALGEPFDATHKLRPEWVTALVKCGLAEGPINALYIKGSREANQWLIERRKNARKGGLVSQSKEKCAHPVLKQNNAPSSFARAPTDPLFSISLNTNTKDKELKASTKKTEKNLASSDDSKKESSPVSEFIAEFIRTHQNRFGEGSRPELGGRVLGMIKNLLNDQPLGRMKQLIQTYYQMEDPWFQKKGYDFGTFYSNIQKVSIALDTGTTSNLSHINWSQVFKEGNENDTLRISDSVGSTN